MTRSPGRVSRTLERIRPRELGSLEGVERSRERDRRIALSAVSSGLATATGIAVALISIPLTVRYLGVEQYGLWVTIGSITAFVGFADLGLSSGLVSAVSEAHVLDDDAATRRSVASAFYLLLAIAVLLSVLFAIVDRAVSWAELFNVSSSDARSVAAPAVAVFVAMTVVAIPLGIAARIRSGYQEGYANGVWQAVASVISLVALVVVIALDAELPWLVLALGSAPLVSSLLNGGALLRRRPWLVPKPTDVSLEASGRLLRLGVLFFILQAASVVAIETDNLIIARILGAEAVASYAIPMKLFLFVPLAANLFVAPMWPAYREALTRRDHAWVTSTMRRAVIGTVAWGLGATALLLVVGRPLVSAWAGRAVAPEPPLLAALATFAFLLCVSNPLAVYMNARNVIGFQAACVSVMVVSNLVLSIVLTHAIGISGPAWGSAISLALAVLVPYALHVRTSLRRLGAERTDEVEPRPA